MVNGQPDSSITALYLPNCTQITMMGAKVNSNQNYFALLDNPDNKKLEMVQFYGGVGYNSIPSNFPVHLKLVTFTINQTPISSNIPQSLFSCPSIKDITILSIPMINNSLTFDYNPDLYYPNLRLMMLNSNAANPNQYFNITQDRYPKLTNYQLFTNNNISVVINSPLITIFKLELTTTVPGLRSKADFTQAPNLATLGLRNVNFIPSDLTKFPYLASISAYNCSDITNASHISTLAIGSYPNFPPVSWLAPQASISVQWPSAISMLPDYSSIRPKSFNVIGNSKNIYGPVPEYMCRVGGVSLASTNVSSVPSCFYAYWLQTNNSFPSTVQPPPADLPPASELATLDSDTFIVRNGMYRLTINGNNLGFGISGDYIPSSMVMTVPSTTFTYVFSGFEGSDTVTFSKLYNVTKKISWFLDNTTVSHSYAEINDNIMIVSHVQSLSDLDCYFSVPDPPMETQPTTPPPLTAKVPHYL
ncbi:hypothetical protein SAMD00019534_018310 [Acytostelium subglobosum LB1]|uniref:hypothetical protein n=1 Tax=Acytostelium subglobosum LB1 TaxID=1410327 RepID=UPI000644B039|nr:hypothetical protein SAMD00019534_018310 [Acytostelium subglobosum LB1]GAM18656.1 hypothetical protein SAMD00019534_018310 [Acytostelium subglobosum LB1]|eukprot:XP_012757876.1 hypothetical protein SAMD00019534_018310 [Acytostelium subglobosum LB1]